MKKLFVGMLMVPFMGMASAQEVTEDVVETKIEAVEIMEQAEMMPPEPRMNREMHGGERRSMEKSHKNYDGKSKHHEGKKKHHGGAMGFFCHVIMIVFSLLFLFAAGFVIRKGWDCGGKPCLKRCKSADKKD